MTTQANIPAKWYVPFANGDGSRVELPVTTADPTRASQTLGFPPLTMQPPESGGVPPQGEDFNGGMNQIARVAWWVLNGGGWPYDASFATQANIQGYPNGAKLQSADFRGDWISTTDSNQNNPDTVGTGWVPGFQYGVTALTGLTGGTVTPTPAQAAKNSITLAGTLTSALTIVLPTWLKNWTITNSTTGAFVTIVKTAAGSGVTIPQNGAPTRVSGDGTNITQVGENIANATTSTQALSLGRAPAQAAASRNARMSVTGASASATFTADEIVVETALGGNPFRIGSYSQVINLATTGAGGMDTGTAPVSGYVSLYAIYNVTTGTASILACAQATSNGAIYAGANMPSGFTASALIASWPTNASSQFVAGVLTDRTVAIVPAIALSTNSTQASLTSLSIAGQVPLNAKVVLGYNLMSSTTTTSAVGGVLGVSSNGIAQQSIQGIGSTSMSFTMPLQTAQTIFYTSTNAAGTFNQTIAINAYVF